MAAVDIVIQAKNKVSAGLSKAGASLKKFGDTAKRIGKSVGGAFKLISRGVLVLGGAVVGIATKALMAYAKQEKAEAQLGAALRANGQNADALLPKYKALASAIQDQTGVADEATLANMALLNTLGVGPDKMEEATKATIALQKAGMGEEAATRAAALAVQGNYDMLNRYIPALRETKDESEKLAIFQDLVTRGYQQQTDELKTTAGRWNELKGRVGDAWEALGEGISTSSSVGDELALLSKKVKELTANFAEWAASGGIERLIAKTKIFVVDFATKMQNAKDLFQGFADSVGENAFYAFDQMRVAIINAFSSVKTTVENVAYNAAAVFFNMVDDIKGSTAERLEFKGLQDGLAEADKSMAESSKALEKAYDKIIARDKETADKIKAINDKLYVDLKIKAYERAKAEEEARKKSLEGEKSDAEEVVKATDVITAATYDLGDAIEAATENATELGKTFATDFEIDKFVNSVKRLANGLKDIPEVKSLAWLKDLGKIKISRISGTAVAKFVHSIKMLADGLKDIPYVNIGSLKDLGDIKLSKLSGFEVKKFTAAMRSLSAGLDGVTLPDLSLGLESGDIDKMTKLAESLSKVKGGTVKIAFTDTISKAIVQNEVNTASIKSNLEKLLVVK